MKNPFKAFLIFLVFILLILFLGSCSTSHRGYNYKAHQKKSTQVMKKTMRNNRGHGMLDHQCTNRSK
jgi:exopolysaccharide biosynthesis protein